MDCDFGIKVSLLLDGELSEQEREQTKKHLENCADCRQLEQDFLFFRNQIKESVKTKDFELPEILSEKPTPFWKKAIRVPVPVLSVLLIGLIGFGAWFLRLEPEQTQPLAKEKPIPNRPDDGSLARYDKGGRAEIYVVQTEKK